ncbi:hypothetical protein [Maribacter sp. 2210JD10-5]|uniref:hypothetical protein n=1 Tax=Maribacter sp. 2210JD10-5 TaxID=3386272 RepID=UPI0039BCC2DB
MFRKYMLIILLIGISAHGQGESVNENLLIFKSPSPNLISLALQTHKQKLRFGEQDNYFITPHGDYINAKAEEYLKVDMKTVEVAYGRQGFITLLKMKFQADLFDNMDKEYFTERTNNMYEEDLKSYTAQNHILKAANSLSTRKEMKRYFCNSDLTKEKCERTYGDDNYSYRSIGQEIYWGGMGANEFQRLRNYKEFVNANLKTLQQWSAEVIPDNVVDGYFVAKSILGKYDFKAKGYWLRDFHGSNNFLVNFYNLEPVDSYERKLLHKNGTQILLKMSPEVAESFSKNHEYIFMVFDIKAKIKGVKSYRNDTLKTSYSLNSPIINLYTDDSLTLNIGELDITNMTTRTR